MVKTGGEAHMQLQVIARIRSGFPEKFGIPRQSGLVEELRAAIHFEPAFQVPEALRGLEGFSHIWLIWGFSKSERGQWSPTVRPPRLGGEQRVGVFASRSPYRPNALGLSCVRLLGIVEDHEGHPVLQVAGADLMDGSPIYDIKPYLPYADSRPDALGGYADVEDSPLEVDFPDQLLSRLPPEHREAVIALLRQDPRPRYQDDPERVYGFSYGRQDIRFRVRSGRCQVVDVVDLPG